MHAIHNIHRWWYQIKINSCGNWVHIHSEQKVRHCHFLLHKYCKEHGRKLEKWAIQWFYFKFTFIVAKIGCVVCFIDRILWLVICLWFLLHYWIVNEWVRGRHTERKRRRWEKNLTKISIMLVWRMIIDNTIFFSSLLGLNGMPKVKKKTIQCCYEYRYVIYSCVLHTYKWMNECVCTRSAKQANECTINRRGKKFPCFSKLNYDVRHSKVISKFA